METPQQRESAQPRQGPAYRTQLWHPYTTASDELLSKAVGEKDPAIQIELYRKLLSNYPGTQAAEKAASALDALLSAAASTHPEARVTICTWRGNKRAVVSLTFDDANPNQIKYHVPLMEQHGFRGTFFLNANAVRDWQPWAELSQKGHEIASHTMTHARLTEASPEQTERELSQSKAVIAQRIGKTPLTFAYPYAVSNDAVRKMAARHYLAARGGNALITPPAPPDLFNVPSFVPVSNTSAEEMNSWVDQAVQARGWVVEMIHGIEGVGWQPLPKETYQAHFDHLASLGSELWVGPFVDVVKYISERAAAKVTTKAIERNRIVLDLSDGLDDATYDAPLTLRLEVPAAWKSVRVAQGDSAAQHLESSLENGAAVVYLDAVPDHGEIQVAPDEDAQGAV